MAGTTGLTKILEDMQFDVHMLEQQWVQSVAEVCTKEMDKIVKQAIQWFYGSYSPSYYGRLGLLNENFKPNIIISGTTVGVSVIYAENGGSYPDQDEPRWRGHKIYHGQDANTVNTYNWEQGSHGKVQTTPIKEMVENMLLEAAPRLERQAYETAIKRPVYRVLRFS